MDASQAAHNGRATVTVDREGIIHQWGDAVTDVVGHSADDALGRSLNVVIPPVLRPLHWWGFDHAMKSGRLNREIFKVPALRKDGRCIWIEGRPKVNFDASGAQISLQDVIRDITAQKEADANCPTDREHG